MEIQENFSPALGFVNRVGIRQYNSYVRYRTRPQAGRWREIDNEIEYTLVTDTDGQDLTRDARVRPISLLTHGNDLFYVEWQHSYENVRNPFSLFGRLEVPQGVYEFSRYRVSMSTGPQRPVSATFSIQGGDFFGGDRLEKAVGLQWRQSAHFFLSLSYLENDVNLPSGKFTSRLGSLGADIAFNARWSLINLIQYDNAAEIVRLNRRLRYQPLAGQEMLLVFDHRSTTQGHGLDPVSNELVMKVAYTFRF